MNRYIEKQIYTGKKQINTGIFLDLNMSIQVLKPFEI
jgi:hypothetical protein